MNKIIERIIISLITMMLIWSCIRQTMTVSIGNYGVDSSVVIDSSNAVIKLNVPLKIN